MYRHLKNTQAEIQALRLLHSVSNPSFATGVGVALQFQTVMYIDGTPGVRTLPNSGDSLSLVPFQALVQHADEPAGNAHVMVISPDVLLSSKCMDSVMAVPSPQLILHSLAYTCILQDRWA